uniref:RRM domain-containing protein n=1 Tax=Ananas comosus var. bracteatus TaxID=296719 RepID=A0A6V7QNZ0_ANACO|nr:unnamed protein product [Ananas comosus var. bracteatus]
MATEEDASKLQSRKKKKKMLLKEPSKEEEKKKKKKKAKKDKWGQPVLNSWDEPQQEEEEEEEEEAGVGGGGGGGGGGDGDEDTYERNKVVVSGMPYSATEQQIRELFDGVGAVRHLHLSRFPDSETSAASSSSHSRLRMMQRVLLSLMDSKWVTDS